MTIGHRMSSSLSSFRFSLNPPASKPVTEDQNHGLLQAPQSISETTPRTKSLDDTGNGSEKDHTINVVETDTTTSNRDATASPITPWNAAFHRNAASAAQETAYLKEGHQLHIARVIISILLLSIGATTTALNADILHHYNVTHWSSDFFLSLWPTDLNLTPTLLVLVSAAVITFLSLLHLLVSAIPTPVSRSALSNGVFTGLITLSLPLTVSVLAASVILSPASIFSTFIGNALTTLGTTTGSSHTVGLSPAVNGVDASPDTIQSFTCQMANSAHAFGSDASKLKLWSISSSDELIPTGFTRLCTETKASYGLMIGMFVIEVVGLTVVIRSIMTERKIRSLRHQREVASMDGEKMPESLIGNEMEA